MCKIGPNIICSFEGKTNEEWDEGISISHLIVAIAFLLNRAQPPANEEGWGNKIGAKIYGSVTKFGEISPKGQSLKSLGSFLRRVYLVFTQILNLLCAKLNSAKANFRFCKSPNIEQII